MSDIDVLVVGAGPTGLTLAGELLRRGLRVRIIDKLPEATKQSRALGVHARTLEIFDDLGIADELIARGIEVGGVTMWAGTTPIIQVDFGDLETRFPFILCVAQAETEVVLGELVVKRGGAIDRPTELASLAQDDTGVTAVLSNGETVRAAWLVGCDGAHSTVRKAIGAEFAGHTYEETYALADVKIDWDVAKNRVSTFFAEDGAVAVFPMRGDRWRVILTAAESLGDQVTLESVSALASRRCGKPVPMSDAVWLAPFRINCRQVERYRHGRVFLAGDAAHVHSPIGGQGMNTGIQDAHNLAWKLALVHCGLAHDALVDSYSPERHAIGQHVLRQTDFATKAATLKGVMVPIRNQVARIVTSFESVRRRVARDAAELTVDYGKSPLSGEHTSSTFKARIGKAEHGESPTVGSRLDFSSGPRPGARALDATLGTIRLSQVFDGQIFTLLLCDGRHPSAAGYATLVAIADRMRARFGDRVIESFLITPRADRPAEIPAEHAVLHDTAGDFEARYGAHTECLYLIRPDLYVGFRSQPADGDALEAHLARFLT